MGTGEDAEIKTPTAEQQILSRINGFRKSGKYCDITLVVGGVKFPAHRNILAGFSAFFEGMVTGGFAEAHQENVTLKSIDASIMENILEYAYTTKTEVDSDNVQLLLHAANFFQANGLLEDCCQFMIRQINAENCLSIHELSELYICPMLKEKSKGFLIKNFSAVSNEKQFLELEAEKVINIIDDDSLCVDKEEVVFDAVMRWFYHKEDQRKTDLAKVLHHVRLAHLNRDFLYYRIRTQKVLSEYEPVRNLLEEVKWYHMLPNRRTELYTTFTRRRHCSTDIEVLMVYCEDLDTGLHKKTYVTEDGVVKGDIPTTGLWYWWSAYGYKMYGLSGDDHQTVLYFNQASNTWLPITPKLKRPVRSRHVLLNLNDHWYSFGDNNTNPANYPKRYDSSADKWNKIAPWPQPVFNPDVVSLNGMIYVVAGTTDNITGALCDHIQCYDPSTNTWTIPTSLPTLRQEPRACAFNEQIYVFSVSCGQLDDRRVDMYDISNNQWKRCADVPQLLLNVKDPHCTEQPVVLGGKIYVVTNTLDGKDRNIMVYSPSIDSWQKFPMISSLRPFNIKGPLLIKR